MRVISANLYYKNPTPRIAARFIKDLKPVAVGLQEASTRHDLYRQEFTPEYRWFDASSTNKIAGAQEIPVLRRRDTIGYGHGGYKISNRDRSDNRGIGQERWLTWVRFQHNKKNYCIINLHPNAAVERSDGLNLSLKIKRVFEYRRAMIALEAEIVRQKKAGFIVIVTGDLNFTNRRRTNMWKYSPRAVFIRNGMSFVNKELDWVAWDKKRMRLSKVRYIPKGAAGADHYWIVADIVPLGT